MQEDLAQNAINYALENKWTEAINANLIILEEDPENIEALNRLAHAYFKIGSVERAKEVSCKILEIDPGNSIAIKSLAKFEQTSALPNSNKNSAAGLFTVPTANLFIEQPGKTKLTSLINLGSEKVCSCLNTGDEVILVPYAHKVSVTTANGEYIGKLTDDLSARLRIHLKNGNKYKVIIKFADKKNVKVFIKGDIVSFVRESSKSLSELDS